MKQTKEERLLELLKDGKWHSGRELALKVSHRFGGYLFTLKEKGLARWEKRLDPVAPKGEVWYEYRLVAYYDAFWGEWVAPVPEEVLA